MIRYVPESSKRTYERRDDKHIVTEQSEQSRNLRHLRQEEQPKIPAPPQPIIEHIEPKLEHKTIRITMSPQKMIALGNAMIALVKKEGFKTNYAIEYDYVEKDLYVDATEEWEKDLMVRPDSDQKT